MTKQLPAERAEKLSQSLANATVDVNETNVAINDSDPARPRACIFDAAGVHADVACRDLAVLEVTALLFQDAPLFHQHFHRLKALYAGVAVPAPPQDVPPVVVNVIAFVAAIRAAVEAAGESDVYPPAGLRRRLGPTRRLGRPAASDQDRPSDPRLPPLRLGRRAAGPVPSLWPRLQCARTRSDSATSGSR